MFPAPLASDCPSPAPLPPSIVSMIKFKNSDSETAEWDAEPTFYSNLINESPTLIQESSLPVASSLQIKNFVMYCGEMIIYENEMNFYISYLQGLASTEFRFYEPDLIYAMIYWNRIPINKKYDFIRSYRYPELILMAPARLGSEYTGSNFSKVLRSNFNFPSSLGVVKFLTNTFREMLSENTEITREKYYEYQAILNKTF